MLNKFFKSIFNGNKVEEENKPTMSLREAGANFKGDFSRHSMDISEYIQKTQELETFKLYFYNRLMTTGNLLIDGNYSNAKNIIDELTLIISQSHMNLVYQYLYFSEYYEQIKTVIDVYNPNISDEEFDALCKNDDVINSSLDAIRNIMKHVQEENCSEEEIHKKMVKELRIAEARKKSDEVDALIKEKLENIKNKR